MEDDKELQQIIENKKGTRKVYLTIECVVIAIIGIIGLLFGKVVEATIFEEVAKGVVMAILVGLVVCVICYVPVTMLSDARLKLRPIYGKTWFKKALKFLFNKK